MATPDAARPLAGYTIGIVGLGLMGGRMARNLLEAGADVIGWNRSPEALGEFVSAGGEPAASAAAVAERTAGKIVIAMLWSGAVLREVLGGKDGFLETLTPGSLFVDMGTTDMATTRWLHRAVTERGADFLDAPVSGGTRGAEERSLSIFAGGGTEAFDRACPVFAALGQTITLMGGPGSGQVTKLANQVIVAESVAAVAEALRLAEAAGVDPGKVRDAIRGGFAESRILELHGRRMVHGDFEPGGRISAQLKDVVEAQKLAREMGLELPALNQNVSLWKAMVEDGMGEIDHSAVYRFLESRRS